MVEMPILFEPVAVDTGSADKDGKLAFVGNRLVAVLVRLSEMQGAQAGEWIVETMFDSGAPLNAPWPSFKTLQDAASWIARRHGCTIRGSVDRPTLKSRRAPGISLTWDAVCHQVPNRPQERSAA